MINRNQFFREANKNIIERVIESANSKGLEGDDRSNYVDEQVGEKMSELIEYHEKFKNLMSLSDNQLRVYNSNQRVDFSDFSEKFLAYEREVTEGLYEQLTESTVQRGLNITPSSDSFTFGKSRWIPNNAWPRSQRGEE
jgi:hypothetical protein